MKYLFMFLTLIMMASCAKGEIPTQTPESTQIPSEVTTTETTSLPDSTPVTDSTTTASNTSTHDPYYDELRKQCREVSEEKQTGCNASISVMEKSGYIEADYDKNGNLLPCSEGLVANTIRSPGSLTWCQHPAQ